MLKKILRGLYKGTLGRYSSLIVVAFVGQSGSGKSYLAEKMKSLVESYVKVKIVNVGDVASKLAKNTLSLKNDVKLRKALEVEIPLSGLCLLTGLREKYLLEYFKKEYTLISVRVCAKEATLTDRLKKRGLRPNEILEKRSIENRTGVLETEAACEYKVISEKANNLTPLFITTVAGLICASLLSGRTLINVENLHFFKNK